MSSDEQQQSRLFNELCTLFLALLRSPHLFFPSSLSPSPRLRGGGVVCRPRRCSRLSPSGLALLLLGASLALMICGSVTFVLGFILIPWVIGFVMLMYFVGIISILSGFGKAILCPAVPAPSLISPEEVSGELFSKLPII